MTDHPVPHRLIIFDADWTLRRCTVDKQPCPNAPDEYEIIDHARVLIREHYLDAKKYKLAIASNQGGVEYGFVTMDVARKMLQQLALDIWGYAPVELIKMCPHMDCMNRKPKPGMLDDLMYDTATEKNDTLFIGDLGSDKEAAEAAGVQFMTSQEFFNLPF